MATNTANYNFILPAVNDPTDQNLWGGYLNTNFSNLDSFLKTASEMAIGAAKTGNYTIQLSDQNALIRGDATGGAFDFDLPSAATVPDGFMIVLSKIDSSANAITIDPDGSDTCDVSSLGGQFSSVMLVCDGSSHWAVALRSVGEADQVVFTAGDVLSTNVQDAIEEVVITATGAASPLSGSSVAFTGIPANAKRVTLVFTALSTNGTSNVLVRGNVGGVAQTTGYNGITQTQGITGANWSSGTQGAQAVVGVAAAGTYSGKVVFTLVGSNTWQIDVGSARRDTAGSDGSQQGSGDVALSGTLDGLTILTSNTFDAGTARVYYEV